LGLARGKGKKMCSGPKKEAESFAFKLKKPEAMCQNIETSENPEEGIKSITREGDGEKFDTIQRTPR